MASIPDADDQCDAALPVARDVDARMQAAFGERNQAALIEHGNLGFKKLSCGDRERGLELLAAAESGLRRHFGDHNIAAHSFRFALASELSDAGRHAEVLALLDAVDPDAMTAAESSTGWPERVRTLRGEILGRLAQAHLMR